MKVQLDLQALPKYLGSKLLIFIAFCILSLSLSLSPSFSVELVPLPLHNINVWGMRGMLLRRGFKIFCSVDFPNFIRRYSDLVEILPGFDNFDKIVEFFFTEICIYRGAFKRDSFKKNYCNFTKIKNVNKLLIA